MGLFDRARKKETLADGIEGTATIVGAKRDADWAGKAQDGESWWWEDAYGSFAKQGYELELEVSVPGREPYTVRGRFKAPAKAERVGLTRASLSAGIELPVRVDRSDPERVEIDWDRFAADPARKDAIQDARLTRQNTQLRAQLEKDPEQQKKMWAMNKGTASVWAGAVKMGSMTREEFERDVALEVDSGRMDPADADAARALLDR